MLADNHHHGVRPTPLHKDADWNVDDDGGNINARNLRLVQRRPVYDEADSVVVFGSFLESNETIFITERKP